jgi:hypothetical protein
MKRLREAVVLEGLRLNSRGLYIDICIDIYRLLSQTVCPDCISQAFSQTLGREHEAFLDDLAPPGPPATPSATFPKARAAQTPEVDSPNRVLSRNRATGQDYPASSGGWGHGTGWADLNPSPPCSHLPLAGSDRDRHAPVVPVGIYGAGAAVCGGSLPGTATVHAISDASHPAESGSFSAWGIGFYSPQ